MSTPEDPVQQPPVAGYGQPPASGAPPPGYGPPPVYGAPPPQQGYGGYGVPPYGQQRSTNGFAIASMVLGILWLWWIGSILALVFGYIARGQIKDNHQNGDGMAIAGIVLGWIGVGMFGLVVLGAAAGGL